MEVTGKIMFIGEEQTFGKYTKKEMAINTIAEKYPQDILVVWSNDNIGRAKTAKVGDEVTVSFNLRGRKWVSPQGEVRYFNTLDAWKIEFIKQANPQTPSKPQPESLEYQDDLPF